MTGGRPRRDSQLIYAERAIMRASQTLMNEVAIAVRLPEPPTSRWHRAGVTPRIERVFDSIYGLILVAFAIGWSWSIAAARAEGSPDAMTEITATITSALTDPSAPTAAFLTDAALEAFAPLRGQSGRLRARIQRPGEAIVTNELPEGAHLELTLGSGAETTTTSPRHSGVWRMAIRLGSAIKPVTDLNVITLRPFEEKNSGRIGRYLIGSWPGEKRRGLRNSYANPSGFIEVTLDNQDTYVSQHFRLRDFLTKDQARVWPKYLVLETKMVDKLELVLADLQSRGYKTHGVKVLSGFRTPQYNRSGGDPKGRAALSRHMYGDAADIYIDNNGDGRMDDLNGDRRINLNDARVIQQSVDRVERAHPALAGGCGIYPGTGAHGPFVHIDTRGFRARWIGSRDSA